MFILLFLYIKNVSQVTKTTKRTKNVLAAFSYSGQIVDNLKPVYKNPKICKSISKASFKSTISTFEQKTCEYSLWQKEMVLEEK